MQRKYEDYFTFFSSLQKLEPRLTSLQAYGTDGEEALVSALETCFSKAVGLRCFIHKQRNLELHLRSVSATAQKEIIRDIFGIQQGEVFSLGLVDAGSMELFDLELEKLHERWEALAPGFHKWFLDTQVDTFRDHMISSVREKAQLGSPPTRYSTNPNESSNFVVKKWVGFTKSSWPAFVDKLQNLVEAQLSESCRAVYGTGEYALAPHVSSLLVSPAKWHCMSEKERCGYIRKVVNSHLHSTEERPQGQGESRLQKLSVSASEAKLMTVSQATIQNIWGKAERLLNHPGSITVAPGSDSAYMVASCTSKRPHFVQLSRNGKVVCDDQCAMWRGCQLCSHTVAVAGREQVLPRFLGWLQNSRQECNLTKLLTTPKERKSAGTKSGKPTRKSGSYRQTIPITAYRSRVDDVCASSASQSTASVDASHSPGAIVNVSLTSCESTSTCYNWCPPSSYAGQSSSIPPFPSVPSCTFDGPSAYGYYPDLSRSAPPHAGPSSPLPPPPPYIHGHLVGFLAHRK